MVKVVTRRAFGHGPEYWVVIERVVSPEHHAPNGLWIEWPGVFDTEDGARAEIRRVIRDGVRVEGRLHK